MNFHVVHRQLKVTNPDEVSLSRMIESVQSCDPYQLAESYLTFLFWTTTFLCFGAFLPNAFELLPVKIERCVDVLCPQRLWNFRDARGRIWRIGELDHPQGHRSKVDERKLYFDMNIPNKNRAQRGIFRN